MNFIVSEETQIAFAEVYDILKHSKMDIKAKMSKKFVNIIKQNMDKSYQSKIDYNKNINDQNIQYETKVILGLIYRDYLCRNKTRQELLQKEKEELREIEIVEKEKYNTDTLFKKKDYINNHIEETTVAMIKYKDSLIYRIIKKIKGFFKLDRTRK